LAFSLAPLISFRECAKVLNRIRQQSNKNSTTARTVCNIIERQGNLIRQNIEEKAEVVLKENGIEINEKTISSSMLNCTNKEVTKINQEIVNFVSERYNSDKKDEFKISTESIKASYEEPKVEYAQISADDVLARHQKDEGREKDSLPPEKRSFVKNSIVHIQSGLKKYHINSFSIDKAFKILLAFILMNSLNLNEYLIFYADGAADIKCAIQKYFSWIKYKLILDWYHLDKKCKQRLSSAIKNKVDKEEILRILGAHLWLGNIDNAIKYLRDLNKNLIKSQTQIDLLIQYIEKNRPNIPCYALRKELGLRISSNSVEKSNDLFVANRQKDNNTSWSKYGSVALTTISALNYNNEKNNWLDNKTINMKFFIVKNKAA
jgi:hypothetical protein